MTQIPGSIRVTGTITPTDSTDVYPTHDSIYGKGGYREVDTIDDRDNIPIERRKIGMLVFVSSNNTIYQLINSINNDDWIEYNTDINEIDWSVIENKPTSTVEQLDSAVLNIHTHTNKEIIDIIGKNTITNNPQWDNKEWPIRLYPSLTQSYLTTYTVDTWTDVYVNSEVSIVKAVYFNSIINKSDVNAVISLKITDAEDNDVFVIIPETTLSAYSGIENNNSLYGILPTYKIKYKSSVINTECVLTIGDINGTVCTIKDVSGWNTIYTNNNVYKNRLALISIINTSEESININLRVIDNENIVLYYISPPMTLPDNKSIENTTGMFILEPTQKIEYYSASIGTQILITLLNN